jgi:hypothetical protein
MPAKQQGMDTDNFQSYRIETSGRCLDRLGAQHAK